MGQTIAFSIIFFMIGMFVFSFANVVIDRLAKKQPLFKSTSKCPACGEDLKGIDMLPLVYFIMGKGKCKSCGAKLQIRRPLIEIFGGALAVGLTLYYGANLEALTVFALMTVLTIITFIDIDIMEIPPQLNAIILGLGIISIWTTNTDVTLLQRIIGLFCISLPLFIIVLIIPEGFGGGDIKMMFAAGFFLGWKATVVAFFIGLILGGAYGVILLIRRKKGKQDHFAFGPFLSVGIAISVFCGSGLMDMYIESIRRSFYV